jgi:hypothetical protein
MQQLTLKRVAAYSLLLMGLTGTSLTIAASPQRDSQPLGKPQTWAKFIEQHPKVTVEYRYPSFNPIKIASNGDEQQSTVKLPAGTPVVLKVLTSLSSQTLTESSTVTFSVLNDVKVNDVILIKAGTKAQAQVSTINKAGLVGQSGKILISDFSTRTIDDTYVPLRGTVSSKANSRVVLSGVLSFIICPLFLLMRGKEAIIPAGTEKTVFTAADVELKMPQQQQAQ